MKFRNKPLRDETTYHRQTRNLSYGKIVCMIAVYPRNKKSVFSASASSALALLLFAAHPFFAFAQQAPAAPSLSDFKNDIAAATQNLASSAPAQAQQKIILDQDYKSAWDAFGINPLIDGNLPAAQVNNQIAQDIIQSVETSQNYNQEEANYLQETQTTPEQIQSVERATGVDLPPGQSVDAHPSIDANPEADFSSVSEGGQDNAGATVENATSTQNVMPAHGIGSTTPEMTASTTTENSVLETGTSTPDTGNIVPGTSTSAQDTAPQPSEDGIFNAILSGEQQAATPSE